MASVPDAAVGYLLQYVVEFIAHNYQLISEAEENFNKLRRELGTLDSFLQECTEKYSNIFLDNLANRVRDLIHRAEDVVESFIVETARHNLKGTFKQLLPDGKYKLRVRNLAEDIKKISEEIQQFYSTTAPLGLEALKQEKLKVGEEEARNPRNLKPPVDDTVVGLQDETEKVVNLLIEGEEQLDVISIVGMYGLGKTTLAKKVFSDSRIGYKFFIRVFVEVSQDFKREEIFLKIIDSFPQAPEDVKKMSEDKLAETIRGYLEKRTYLIVLDDVWTKESWDELKCAFPTNDKRCRVLITTREVHVAEYARKISKPHGLRFLYSDEAHQLLRLKVFDEKEYRLAADLEALEVRILKRCQGLPLAIVVIAGMLRSHRDDSNWWTQVADGVKDYDPRVREQTDYVIKLSFDRLPYNLKPCFLYLGIFREDSEISVRTLLRLWISEGLIPPSNGTISSEDIAAYYLQNLIDRSLVMVQKRRSNDQAKTIKIHDTLREFCKAHAQKEHLFLEIKRTNMPTDDDRRLCINSESELPDYISRMPSGAHVRSFLCFAKNHFILAPDKISSIPKAFKLLRVLDIRSIKFTRFPLELYYLVLLKYIAIYGDFKSLPKKMSNLWNLQTLIVQTSAGTTLEINADIWKMAQLRHLETNASATLLEPKEGSLSNANLQTLSTISSECCKKEVFAKTPMLKKLGIQGKLARILEDEREGEIWSSGLSRLEKLENLKLLNKIAEKVYVLPSWDRFPSNLAKLTLLNTLLDWKHISTLGKLGNLKVLKLKDNAFQGIIWNTEDGGFKHLKVLHIGKTDLTVWKASSSNFPALTRLYLKHCTELQGIPEGLLGISRLQMIDLYSTNDMLVSSARRFQAAKFGSDKNFKLFVYPPDQL